MRHFEISGSTQEAGRQFRKNITCHVVAESAQRALSLALEKHPEMDVWGLQHKGNVDIIEDTEEVSGDE